MKRQSAGRPLRTVIFTDVNGPVSATLVRETLRIARERGDFEVCALVTVEPAAFGGGPGRAALRFARRTLTVALNADVPLSSIRSPTLDLGRLSRKTGIPVLVPEDGDANGASFVRRLADECRPDVAMSFYCVQVFRRPLLDLFAQAVNYHDSLLPAHRGLLATSFSIYNGDPVTGFTYHRMTEAVDGGPIIVQGSLPIAANEPLAAVRQRKLAAAVAALPEVMDLVSRRDPGRTQVGSGEYHSRRQISSLLDVDRATGLTRHELGRRLRAFGYLRLAIDGVRYPVTRLRESTASRHLAITTSDGALLEPDRLAGLPPLLYKLSLAAERSAASGRESDVRPPGARGTEGGRVYTYGRPESP